MRKIKENLRLRYEAGLSYRAVAQSLNIGYGTVVDYLKRAQRAQVSWPLPPNMGERELGRLLFPTQATTGQRRFSEPDFPGVFQELKCKGVTKQLLWQEYRQCHPDDGCGYAQFCHRYRIWLGCQQRSMRQLHESGIRIVNNVTCVVHAIKRPVNQVVTDHNRTNFDAEEGEKKRGEHNKPVPLTPFVCARIIH